MKGMVATVVLSLIFLTQSAYSQIGYTTISGNINIVTVYDAWVVNSCDFQAAFGMEDVVHTSGDPFTGESAFYLKNTTQGRALLASILAKYNNGDKSLEICYVIEPACGKKVVAWIRFTQAP